MKHPKCKVYSEVFRCPEYGENCTCHTYWVLDQQSRYKRLFYKEQIKRPLTTYKLCETNKFMKETYIPVKDINGYFSQHVKDLNDEEYDKLYERIFVDII